MSLVKKILGGFSVLLLVGPAYATNKKPTRQPATAKTCQQIVCAADYSRMPSLKSAVDAYCKSENTDESYVTAVKAAWGFIGYINAGNCLQDGKGNCLKPSFGTGTMAFDDVNTAWTVVGCGNQKRTDPAPGSETNPDTIWKIQN